MHFYGAYDYDGSVEYAEKAREKATILHDCGSEKREY